MVAAIIYLDRHFASFQLTFEEVEEALAIALMDEDFCIICPMDEMMPSFKRE
jgi:hypothetical protein